MSSIPDPSTLPPSPASQQMDQLAQAVHAMRSGVFVLLAVCVLISIYTAVRRAAERRQEAARAARRALPTTAQVRASIDRDHQMLGLPTIQWPQEPDTTGSGRP